MPLKPVKQVAPVAPVAPVAQVIPAAAFSQVVSVAEEAPEEPVTSAAPESSVTPETPVVPVPPVAQERTFSPEERDEVIKVCGGIALIFIVITVVIIGVLFAVEAENPEVEKNEDVHSRVTPAVEAYQIWALEEHNRLREMHHAGILKMNTFLMTKAFECAEYYAKKGDADHTCPSKVSEGNEPKLTYGENLFLIANKTGTGFHFAKKAIDHWYNESHNYDFDKGGPIEQGMKIAHFTQMVWKSTTELGIAFLDKHHHAVVVGLYNPIGNVMGAYGQNVFRA